MSVVGYQDFWVAGARCLFKRDDINSVPQPIINLGLIKSVTPAITPTEIKLFDPAGGVLNLVDQAVTQQEESYDINCANFNGENLSLLFLSTPPASFTQAAGGSYAQHVAHEGMLLKVWDSNETPLFNLSGIQGVYKTDAAILTTLTQVTFTSATVANLTFTGADPTTTAGMTLVVHLTSGLTTKFAGTYTVISQSGSGPYVVSATRVDPEAGTNTGDDSGAVTATRTAKDAAADTVTWEVVSLVRGEIRILTTPSTLTSTESGIDYLDVYVAYSTESMSGRRLITPQSIKGSVKGTMWLWLGRENDTRQSVRECRVSILPSGQNLRADDFSDMTLKVSVLSNITDDDAGRLIQVLGDLPDQS